MVDLAGDRLLKISDVAKRFGVHRRTVEGWLDRGLESVMVGRLVFTSFEAIQRFSRPRNQTVQSVEDRMRGSSEQRLMDDAARRHGLID